MPSDRTDTPSERVEQATRALWFEADFADSRDTLQGAMDELIAAVRAEERARVREMVEGVPTHEDHEGRLHHRTALMFASDVLRLLTDREGT
jgi:hypothetical protein